MMVIKDVAWLSTRGSFGEVLEYKQSNDEYNNI